MYSCVCPEPGRIAEPYHIPGYSGHVPSMRARNGGSFGKLTRDVLEDPCVPQAPVPILQPPMCPPCGMNTPRSFCCGPPPMMSIPCQSRAQSGISIKATSSSSCYEPQQNVGCKDLGCFSGSCCPPPRTTQAKVKIQCEPLPCCEPNDPRAHHLNRGPYVCPCKPEPDTQVYRCCESLSPTYTGHVPGFTFHSNGRTFGKVTWGTKQYMNNCIYYNTFLQ